MTKAEQYLDMATDTEKYQRMTRVFAGAETPEDLQMLTMMYIMDMNYERADIALALSATEKDKGWNQ